MTLVIFVLVIVAGAGAIYQWSKLTRAAREAATEIRGDQGLAAVEELTAEIVGACMQRGSAATKAARSKPRRTAPRPESADHDDWDEERPRVPRRGRAPEPEFDEVEDRWDEEPAPRARRRPSAPDDEGYSPRAQPPYYDEGSRRRGPERVDGRYDEFDDQPRRRSGAYEDGYGPDDDFEDERPRRRGDGR